MLPAIWPPARSMSPSPPAGGYDTPATPGLTARPYFNRYTEDALDLCDVLSKRRK
jgi:hypothetical protein